jgi:hypothetical protein
MTSSTVSLFYSLKKKKFPREKEGKIVSIEIYNKHQEDTFNYKRRKNIYEKKKSSFIFLCVLRKAQKHQK